MNFRYLYIVVTNADLISWNRSLNSVYRYSKGKQLINQQTKSLEIPEYTRQLNNFLQQNYNSNSVNSQIAQLREKLKDSEKIYRASDYESKREKIVVSKNRYERIENFKDHYLRFQLP